MSRMWTFYSLHMLDLELASWVPPDQLYGFIVVLNTV